MHLFWQRNIWLPILLALACLLLPRRPRNEVRSLTTSTRLTCALLIVANWIAFSVLGGALLTRYLLPVYPIILLLCVDTWRDRTRLARVADGSNRSHLRERPLDQPAHRLRP